MVIYTLMRIDGMIEDIFSIKCDNVLTPDESRYKTTAFTRGERMAVTSL